MRNLSNALESLLDADFDIHDEDINQLEEFLKKWKYGNKTKMAMPFDEFCTILGYSGTEILHASINDIIKAIKSGNGFICVSKDKLHKRTNWCLYWPKSKTQYNKFDVVNQVASWSRPSFGTAPNNLEWECSGLAGQKQVAPWYLPNECRFFELPSVQYEKFLKVLG